MSGFQLNGMLDSFIPVGLDEMSHARLMDRIDTKYLLPAGRIPDFLNSMNGKYKILQINNCRSLPYLTTYLDTTDYLFFNQHVTGKTERIKVRYREYQITGTTYLEIKKRIHKNRTIKWRTENNLTPDFLCDETAIEFIKEYIPQKSISLKPILSNSFKRITLVGTGINERITLDYDLSFSDMKGKKAGFPSIAVIEIKQERLGGRSNAADIMKKLHIRPTGFSKYCIGTAILQSPPKMHLLKPKLLMIKKIENEYTKCC